MPNFNNINEETPTKFPSPRPITVLLFYNHSKCFVEVMQTLFWVDLVTGCNCGAFTLENEREQEPDSQPPAVLADNALKMAGAGGFEPPNDDTKNRWLTTCRRPNWDAGHNPIWGKAQRDFCDFLPNFANFSTDPSPPCFYPLFS